ncbi:hypothetical protein GCM10023223_04810 [Stackebrandtia albiflava]
MIVLNGGSSSGKTGIARCLQTILPHPWLAFGIDDLVSALPATGGGIDFDADGGVTVHTAFRELERAWMAGIAATAGAGARVVVDDVFLSGVESQRRWRTALSGLSVLWVGVRCSAEVAADREVARGDRAVGMALRQAESVHTGVGYDLEVDTTHTEAMGCARIIAGFID